MEEVLEAVSAVTNHISISSLLCHWTESDNVEIESEQDFFEYVLAHDGDAEDGRSNTEEESTPLPNVREQHCILALAKLILSINDAPTSCLQLINGTQRKLRKKSSNNTRQTKISQFFKFTVHSSFWPFAGDRFLFKHINPFHRLHD